MILNALCELAEEQRGAVADGDLRGDLAFMERAVDFHVVLGDDGASLVARWEDVASPRGPRREVKRELVPLQYKRSGTAPKPHFLVDNAKFVFGVSLDPESGDREDADIRPRRFRERVKELLAGLPYNSDEHRAVEALLRFLNAPGAERRALLREACQRAGNKFEKYVTGSAQFAFEYGPLSPTPIHLLPAVVTYWRGQRDKSGQAAARCLVSGRFGPLAESHPNLKGVPGATGAGAALVSFNQPAFWSYGLLRNENAPISRDTAELYVKALNSLLERGPTRQNVRISSSDSVVVFWARGGGVEWVLAGLDGDSPEAVREMLRTPQKGRPAALDDPRAFYSLVLSGAQGRCVVRSSLETTVADAARAMDTYLAETAIERPYGRGVGNCTLDLLIDSIGIEGRQTTVTDADLATRLYLSALRARPFPATLLSAAVRRNKAEAAADSDRTPNKWNRFAARAALVRGVLVRNHRMEVAVALDLENKEPAYLLGRLFAVLDRVQQDALGKVNASTAERYYGAASSTPAAVFPTLLRRSQHHLAKLGREKTGLAIRRDKVFAEIMGGLDGFKRTMNLPEQGLFALGFHHQRQDFFRTKENDK